MKKVIQLFVLAALATTLALHVVAQTPASTGTTTAASGQDDAEAKARLYDQFTKNRTTNPSVAYDAGKQYLAKYEPIDGPTDQYVAYIKKWVASYEKIARRADLLQQIKDKKVNDAYASSKQVLTDYPDDLVVLYQLAGAGYVASTSGNEANNPDAIGYTKRTIQLIQSGKSFDPNKPLAGKDKDEIVANLNFALGILQMKSAPSDAIASLINAAQTESTPKKDPVTYSTLAELYESSQYTNLANQYNTSCKAPDQATTPTCTELSTKVNQVVDHIIDALARAIAYSNSSPDAAKFGQARAAWTQSLTSYYKYRNNGSDTGLKELIASITSRPLPKPGEPVTPSLIPSTPSTSSTTTPTTPSSSAAPSKTATTTTQSNGKTTSVQPTGKSSGTKTPPKRAHN